MKVTPEEGRNHWGSSMASLLSSLIRDDGIEDPKVLESADKSIVWWRWGDVY